MHECSGPLWPCALTGAAAALAGIDGIGVVIHGSAGCYYYPSSVLHLPLYCSSVTDRDIILGTEDALIRTIDAIRDTYDLIAVLCTCIPSITGEDIRGMLEEKYSDSARICVIDAPGFAGEYEDGFRSAIRAIDPPVSGTKTGVNIDGLSPFDPFRQGNFQEALRLLGLAGTAPGAALPFGNYRYGQPLSPYTLHTNPDLSLDLGESLGSLVGLSRLEEAVRRIASFSEGAGDLLEHDIPLASGKITAACDRFMKRFDPPRAALFGQSKTMQEIALMLEEYLDADILVIGSRNPPVPGKFHVERAKDYDTIVEILSREKPDLVLGSSFEKYACPGAAFVGVTPPLRGTIRLHSRPLAGIEGALALFESVLNACMDQAKKKRDDLSP
ncbi:MAG: nitrogenase component 1 [Methanolinea sp.]|nr:nitrogenase component 1 [Methanolinea sp.]